MTVKASAIVSALATIMFSAPAYAGKSNDTINVVWDYESTTLDYYYAVGHLPLTLAKNVWDGLVERDPATGKILPNLATEWSWESDTSLVMTLREGVRFHNGEEFDADDVVYTMNYLANPANRVLAVATVSWIAGAEKIDKHKVRIKLKYPLSSALEYLSLGVPIYPNEYYAKVGPEGMGRNPVGTGPYKVASFKPGQEYVLERNDNYFKGGAKPRAAIKTVIARTQKDSNLMIGQMMTNQADFIWKLSGDQADQLEKTGRAQVVRSPTYRISTLAFSVDGATGPFTDPRVRQAVAYAINRKSIAENLMRGGSVQLDTVCATAQTACPKPSVVYEYNPEKARKLLAEAGYPNGFDTTLTGYTNRLVGEAVSGDLSKVGIRTNLQFLIFAPFREKWEKSELPIFNPETGFWGVGDASMAFNTYFSTPAYNRARDPVVLAALDKANGERDLAKREALYKQAQDRILEQAYWVPLVTVTTNYGLSKDLAFEPRPDEVHRWYLATWK